MSELEDALKVDLEIVLAYESDQREIEAFHVLKDAARRVANPDYEAAAKTRWEARFGEGSWSQAFDQEVHYTRTAFIESAKRDVNAALGIDPPEDTG